MSAVDVALSPLIKEPRQFLGCFYNCKAGDVPPEDSSILIYISMSGSLIPMRVLESDSVASVKLRIQTFKWFVVKKQRLVFGGRELARNNCLVKDYGVADGDVLHLKLKLSDLVLITVRSTCGQEFEFRVYRWRNVGHVKKRIFKEGKGFVDVDEHQIFYNGEKLDDQKLVTEICDDHDIAIHLLVQKPETVGKCLAEGRGDQQEEVVVLTEEQTVKNFWLEPLLLNSDVKLNSVLQNMVDSTLEGLSRGNPPVRSCEGTGGAYFMQDVLGQEIISVFKPIDEEPNAVNNPHGLPVSPVGEGLKKGTKAGEGAVREAAAYILDHPMSGPRELTGEIHGFAGVPPTVIVRCLHEGFNHPNGFDKSMVNVKIGSLQMFIKNQGSCDDMGPGTFPVEEVHKISVLDMRMANADRHAGNILVSKREDGQTVLIPIDHGYCLPENFEDCTFDWLYWPQAHQPYSPEVVNYIKSLDAEHDIALLRFYGWDVPVEPTRTLRISTMLLKKGVERGLTAFDIGSIMCRKIFNKESLIEEIVHEAHDSLLPGFSEGAFLQAVSDIMDAKLDKLAK